MGVKSLDGTFHRAHFEHFLIPGRSIRDRGKLVRVHPNPSPVQTRAERVAHRVILRQPTPPTPRAAAFRGGFHSEHFWDSSCPIRTRLRDAGTSAYQSEIDANTSRARRTSSSKKEAPAFPNFHPPPSPLAHSPARRESACSQGCNRPSFQVAARIL